MTFEIILRYVHFISIFAIVGTLVAEHLLLKNDMTRAELNRVASIDGVYGLASLALLGQASPYGSDQLVSRPCSTAVIGYLKSKLGS